MLFRVSKYTGFTYISPGMYSMDLTEVKGNFALSMTEMEDFFIKLSFEKPVSGIKLLHS